MKSKRTTAPEKHLALLRGINVGGKNIIRMAALKACFERMGFANVNTHIQSGNVIFDAEPGLALELEPTIERALSDTFDYPSRVVLIPQAALRRIVAQAPAGFGLDPDSFRYDVIFLKPPLAPGEALAAIPVKPGVDAAAAGRHALYFSRLISRAAQSRLSRITQLPVYQSMTIRNWNTTTALLALMDGERCGRQA